MGTDNINERLLKCEMHLKELLHFQETFTDKSAIYSATLNACTSNDKLFEQRVNTIDNNVNEAFVRVYKRLEELEGCKKHGCPLIDNHEARLDKLENNITRIAIAILTGSVLAGINYMFNPTH